MMSSSSTSYVISMSEAEDEPERSFIRQQLWAYNTHTMPQFYEEPPNIPALNVYVKDAAGKLVGGMTAEIHWDWLSIDYLWVDETQRGQGLGARLVQALEAEAMTRGCHHATLTTFDWQARGFYEKLGYRVVGQLDDYPPGHSYFMMRKDFGDTED